MKKIFYIIFSATLFFTQYSMGQTDCEQGEDFESTIGNIEFYTKDNFGNGHEECGDIDNPDNYTVPINFLTPNDFSKSVTIVTAGNDPDVISVSRLSPNGNGTNSLRMNPRNSNLTAPVTKNITILEKEFDNINKRYVVFDYSAIFEDPTDDHTDDLPYVKFNLKNSSGTIIASRCYDSGSFPNSVTNNGSTWVYSTWKTITLDAGPSYMGQDVTLEIIASDCLQAAHDTKLYIDNICNTDTTSGTIITPGDIVLNPIIIPNCPTDPFSINGSITYPTGSNSAVITLIAISDNFDIHTIAGPATFTGSTFNFNINPLIDFPCQTCTYVVITAQVDFSNGSEDFDTESISLDLSDLSNCEDCLNPGSDVTLNFCSNDNTDYNLADYLTGEDPGGLWSNGDGIYNPSTDGSITTVTYTHLGTKNCPRTLSTITIILEDCTISCEELPDITLVSPTDDIQTGNSQNYTLFSNIIASNDIESGASSVYQATETIRLIPGFHSKHGSDFLAIIKPCETTNKRTKDSSFGDSNNQIKVYPNPAKDELHISTEDIKIASIELLNIYGNRIQVFDKLNSFKHSLDVNRLARGYYVIKVTLEDGTTQHKNVVLK